MPAVHSEPCRQGASCWWLAWGTRAGMLGRVLPGGAVTSVALTTDHTPEVPSEAARIRARGVCSPLKVSHPVA